MATELEEQLVRYLDQTTPVGVDEILHRCEVPEHDRAKRTITGVVVGAAFACVAVLLVAAIAATRNPERGEVVVGSEASTTTDSGAAAPFSVLATVDRVTDTGVAVHLEVLSGSEETENVRRRSAEAGPFSSECLPDVAIGGSISLGGFQQPITGWFTPADADAPFRAASQHLPGDELAAYVVVLRLDGPPFADADEVHLVRDGVVVDRTVPSGEWAILGDAGSLVLPTTGASYSIRALHAGSVVAEARLDQPQYGPDACTATSDGVAWRTGDDPSVSPPWTLTDVPPGRELIREESGDPATGGALITQYWAPTAETAAQMRGQGMSQLPSFTISMIEGEDPATALGDALDRPEPVPMTKSMTEVRGLDAVIGIGNTETNGTVGGITWFEGGNRISIIAYGLDADQLHALADGLVVR